MEIIFRDSILCNVIIMPRFHGPHCRLRSFPIKCKKCGELAMFWECTHGCRVLFQYPIYGRPIRHICSNSIVKKSKKNYVLVPHGEHKLQQIERTTYRCPVCKKIFDTDSALNSHIQRLKKSDDNHAEFFGEILDLINFDLVEYDTEWNDNGDDLFEDLTIFDNTQKKTPVPNQIDVSKFRTGFQLKEMDSKIIKSKKKAD
jgi:hypothetical protein